MLTKLIQLSQIFNDGFTLSINNDEINQYSNNDKPYILSYKTLITIKNDTTVFNHVLIPNKCIIGGWKDKDTDTYYIELNKVYKSKQQALKIAKRYKQKAIYNMNTGEVINV